MKNEMTIQWERCQKLVDDSKKPKAKLINLIASLEKERRDFAYENYGDDAAPIPIIIKEKKVIQ